MGEDQITNQERFIHFMDLVPEGCVPEFGIRVISFIAKDGSSQYSYEVAGDSQMSEHLGLIELVKQRLAFEFFREEEEDR